MRQSAQFSAQELKDDGAAILAMMQEREIPVHKTYAVICFVKLFLEKELNISNVQYGPESVEDKH